MPWKTRPYGLKFWGIVIVICILGGFVALGVSRFIEAFYSYEPQGYAPKDFTRER